MYTDSVIYCVPKAQFVVRVVLGKNVFKKRIDRVIEYVNETNTDFALLTPSPGYQYLTGSAYEMHERLVALLIPKDGAPSLIVPAFERSDHEKTTWLTNIHTWTEEDDPYELLAELIDQSNGDVKALFDYHMPLGIYWSIEKAVGGFKNTYSIAPLLTDMRLRKSSEEIALMMKAGRIIHESVQKGFSQAQAGITEKELASSVSGEVTRQGATPTFFAIQFGVNSAMPHHRPDNTELQKGDMVLMDCGCSVSGYNTDMTRVGVFGQPSDEQDLVYRIVLDALKTATEKIKPGMACGTADGIARHVIEESGYGDFFTHRLGHGIGLEVHEPPYIVRGNALQLAKGMTHSIEPGIYLEGKFGVRIEDLVGITDDGVELLTFMPHDLIEMDA